MNKRLECPACKWTHDVADLNETGRAMLAKKGPGLCPKCGARLVEAWTPENEDGSNLQN